MGEGLQAVVVCPVVEKIGSSSGSGDPDSFWNLDDLPEFCGGGHFLDQGPSITRGGILAGLILLSAGLSWVVSLVDSGVGLLAWGGWRLASSFSSGKRTVVKLSSSCDESAVRGLLAGVEVIPSESLWFGAGSSGSLVVGTLVSSSRWHWV